jgi:hypothetical protein
LNIECGCFGTVGGQHVGLVNLAIDATLFFLAALLARRSKDCPVKEIFMTVLCRRHAASKLNSREFHMGVFTR